MEQEQREFPECDRGQYLMCLQTMAALYRTAGDSGAAAEVEFEIGRLARAHGYAGQLARLEDLQKTK